MAKRSITPEFYQTLLQSFRDDPGNYNRAAKLAGCDKRTAKRAWEIGINYARVETGARTPIKDTIAAEQQTARAMLAEQDSRARGLAAEDDARRMADLKDKSRRDAAEARVQEANLVRLARGAAANLLASLTNMAIGASKIGEQVRGALEGIAAPDPATGKPKELKVGEAVGLTRLLGNLTMSLRQVNDAAARAIEMERVLLGEPTATVAINVESMSMDEAERRIQSAMAAFARAKGRLNPGTSDDSGPLPN